MTDRRAAELEAGRLEILLVASGVLVLVAQLAAFIWVAARRHRDQQQRRRDAGGAWRPGPGDAIPYEPRLLRQVRQQARSLVSRVRGQARLAASPPSSPSQPSAAAAKQQEKQPACLRRQMAVLERPPPPPPPPVAAAEQEREAVVVAAAAAGKTGGRPAAWAGAAPGPAPAAPEDPAWEPRRGRTRRRASSRLGELRRREAPRREVQAC